MGNCINVVYQKKKIGLIDFDDGEEDDFEGNVDVETVSSDDDNINKINEEVQAMSLSSNVEDANTYHVVAADQMAESQDQPNPNPNPNPKSLRSVRKVKIVVTKEQLELLLNNRKKVRATGIVVRFSRKFKFGQRCRKWQPSLAAIPEVNQF